jgi:hypothetical protein
MEEIVTTSNKSTSGNGAAAVLFHTGRLRRAVLECERYAPARPHRFVLVGRDVASELCWFATDGL